MENVLATALIGIMATAGMTAFLWTITGLKLSDVDMVRAVGSLATRSLHNSLVPGLFIHLSIGVVISYLYAIFLQIPDLKSIAGFTAIGSFIGLLHGIVVSIALVVLVAEHHPLARFQQAGFQVAIYHILAHVVYGSIIGLLHGFWFLTWNVERLTYL